MSNESTSEDQLIFRNILVALDASSHSMAALETAAQLAQKLEAELHGLFVEDANWFALSKLPFTSEISELTGTRRRMEEGDMERHVMSLISRLRQAMDQMARQHRIAHQFETKRGQVTEEVLAAAKNADLITLGRIGHSYWGGIELGQTVRTLIKESDTPILILQQGIRLGRKVTVLYEEKEDKRSLEIGLRLAQKLGVELEILILREDESEIQQSRKQLSAYVSEQYNEFDIQAIGWPNAYQLVHILNYQRSGILIGQRRLYLLTDNNLEHLLSGIQCPVLLI
jgi:nucleotide-binding universal stress UspA family protein